MIYRLFLYGTTELKSNWATNAVNKELTSSVNKQLDSRFAANYLRPFDTAAVTSRIDEGLTDPVSGKCKCRSSVKYSVPSQMQIAYLYIATSYENAPEVLLFLHNLAVEHDLVLYDAETNRTFYRDLIDRVFIHMRRRRQELHLAIIEEMNPFRCIRCVEEYSERGDYYRSCVVTLRKKKIPFAERVAAFDRFLKDRLEEGETLVCEDQCFKICGECYVFTYVLEGDGNNADRVGFMEEGKPRAELIRRMSTDKAFRWMESNCSEERQKDILKRMRFREMVLAYPNPAQRFVASVNITKWQFKQVFGIDYGGLGPYGPEILFHRVPNAYENKETVSVLMIEEESASFVLPFINDIYPFIYERYYLDANHIPWQMMAQIVEYLKTVKEMILHDTFTPKLKPYIEEFNLFIFEDSSNPKERERFFYTDKTQLTYEYRYEIVGIYDAFIRWAESQLEIFDDRDDLMFNIQGP